MSGIPHHTDLHPSSNLFLTTWFILSVLFLHMSQVGTPESVLFMTSVVPTHVWDPLSHADLQSSSNVYPTSWFILSVMFLTGGETSVVLHMSRIPCLDSTLEGMSTCSAGSFCLCCF